MTNWKGAYVARTMIGAGGCWHRDHDRDAALAGLRDRLRADWSGLFDIDAMLKEGIPVSLFRDGGTTSFADDTFIESVTLTAD